MTPREIADQLKRLTSDADFATRSAELVSHWDASNVQSEALEPILRFMEGNPSVEFGVPGPLVHFAERFYEHGYEEMLRESVNRKPTRHTVWMLNRLINGTEVAAKRLRLIEAMVRLKSNAFTDSDILNQINHLLERLGQ